MTIEGPRAKPKTYPMFAVVHRGQPLQVFWYLDSAKRFAGLRPSSDVVDCTVTFTPPRKP